MKKIFSLFIFQLFIFNCIAQEKSEAILEVDSLNIYKHDLVPNQSYYYEFKLVNIGNKVAEIKRVESTCSGVSPFISKYKINPGDYTIIYCYYTPDDKNNNFNKTINVFTDNSIVGKYQKNKQSSKWNDGSKFNYFLIKGNIKKQANYIPTLTTENKNLLKYIEVDALEKNSGDIPEGPSFDFYFTIKNISKEPILIRSVQTSCGCVVGSWSKEPIQPGKKSEIKVLYLTNGRVGTFSKTAAVIFSNPEVGSLRFTIRGIVIPQQFIEKEIVSPIIH